MQYAQGDRLLYRGISNSYTTIITDVPRQDTTNPSHVKGAAPTGWNIPSKAEWMELVTYLGGLNIAGGKMKETGTSHWKAPNTGATNECGFTALPGGVRDFAMGFLGKGDWLFFLTATAPTSRDATGINISYDDSQIYFGDAHPDDAPPTASTCPVIHSA